jgi:hypothetical protein
MGDRIYIYIPTDAIGTLSWWWGLIAPVTLRAVKKRKTIGYSSVLQCVHFEHLMMAECGRNM